MSAVFGIHVGNSRACLAMCKHDDTKFCVEVIANNSGERVMPAIVTVTENENVVGTACKSLMISRWNTTVTCNKHLMDSNTPDKNNGLREVATIVRENEIFYVLPLEDRTEYRTPIDIAKYIYNSLYEIAINAVPGAKVETSCVLMVPKHFSEEGRIKMRSAAEAVGWNVMQVINEPASAVLGYNLLSDLTPQKVLVYRVGGKSCDVSVMDVNQGMMTILDTEYSEDVGGKLLVTTLTNYLAEEFHRKYKLDPKENHRSLTKLTLAAEDCLHVLSTIESANCFVESLCEGVDFSHTMSRARFESLLSPFLVEFAKPLHSVLVRLNMTPDDVCTVVLCGGLLKIPRLRKYILEIFDETVTKVVPLPNGMNYDEVLACGAANQAGYIASNKMCDNLLPDDTDIPVLKYSLTVKVEGAQCEELVLEGGSPLPVRRTLRLLSPQDLVTLIFLQQESSQAILKGQLQLEELSDPSELKLEFVGDVGIKVEVSEEVAITQHHTVKMFPCPVSHD